jgi:hypothetical protein
MAGVLPLYYAVRLKLVMRPSTSGVLEYRIAGIGVCSAAIINVYDFIDDFISLWYCPVTMAKLPSEVAYLRYLGSLHPLAPT